MAYLHGGAYRVAETEMAGLLSRRKQQALAARRPIPPDKLLTTLKVLPGLEKSAEVSRVVEKLREHGLVSSARIRVLLTRIPTCKRR